MLRSTGEVGKASDEQDRATWVAHVQNLVDDWKASVDQLWNSDDILCEPNDYPKN
ncbi:MAG: hypothetical protein CM1200mP39_12200 [Dehalococcoidia bacterium]|nr:MAG: hypothetical protein CM1200mP39_12200 [Dehalococcoidia bacterium]